MPCRKKCNALVEGGDLIQENCMEISPDPVCSLKLLLRENREKTGDLIMVLQHLAWPECVEDGEGTSLGSQSQETIMPSANALLIFCLLNLQGSFIPLLSFFSGSSPFHLGQNLVPLSAKQCCSQKYFSQGISFFLVGQPA